MDDTISTTAHKVATDESADAICKVFPIGPRMPIPYRARWWGKRLENEDKFSLPQRKQKSERKSSVLKTEPLLGKVGWWVV